ncbi:hypothetical protein GGR34_001579 [Microvirga flocculans]|uniref:Uncharacterized protein n=1 Tax=Microvirga flocculans TaxID=217168 RepID=A0A7W6N7Q8_9HYPH|nr:hypothetical protein [Microvirga flocculans]MBB4039932.1 hypothetical protein [Microvirga flocculans]
MRFREGNTGTYNLALLELVQPVTFAASKGETENLVSVEFSMPHRERGLESAVAFTGRELADVVREVMANPKLQSIRDEYLHHLHGRAPNT